MNHDNGPALQDIAEDLLGLPDGALALRIPSPRRTLYRALRAIGLGRRQHHEDRCQVCGEELDRLRHYSPHLRGYVDLNCVPAIVRREGYGAVLLWLESGEMPAAIHFDPSTLRNTCSRHRSEPPKPIVGDVERLRRAWVEFCKGQERRP